MAKDQVAAVEQEQRDLRTPKEQKALPQIRATYRSVCKEGMGFDMLAHLMQQLGLFVQIPAGDEEARVNHNTAVELLWNLGVLATDADGHVTTKCIRRVVDALLNTVEGD